MFEITENADEKFVEIQLTGKLTKQAYDSFVPMIEEQVKEYGRLRMLVTFHDFHGWDVGALWEDIKFDWKHFRDIERLAIVGENNWEKGMSAFCRPFTTAKIKYFDVADIEDAREWLHRERIPLHHQLVKEDGILTLAPSSSLSAEDFKAVTAEVDRYLEENGKLDGVMIDAKSFPGWDGFSGMKAHFRFIRDHHKRISRVAIVTDDSVLSHLPGFASHFVDAEVKCFPHDEKSTAMEWLRSTP